MYPTVSQSSSLDRSLDCHHASVSYSGGCQPMTPTSQSDELTLAKTRALLLACGPSVNTFSAFGLIPASRSVCQIATADSNVRRTSVFLDVTTRISSLGTPNRISSSAAISA